MFIQSISAFEQEWKHESASTLKIFRALTDASLAQEVAPGHRKLGELAWHIVTTLQEMMSRTGLKFESPDEHTPQPSSAQAIADAYERASQALLEAVLGQWTDASLQEQVNLYGEPWPNGVTLHILVNHEVHHRAQMTVLMRQAGLKVPGVYGPAKEEWQPAAQ
ncbi:DinB family protein [Paenibacillus validus]|uniref:DinB family protein n=1 Tax=Paenibacillus TaxID=44249 RepID=UPI000FDC83F0|nr:MULTISPECIES: DinB family protein [Paenibacillus]MED4603997.1 DinB family protein [Paenibacillus validus]MED4609417.1 DinB family protein [Paenibacillus validus]